MRQSCHRLLEHQQTGGEEPPLYSPIDQISGEVVLQLISNCFARACEGAITFKQSLELKPIPDWNWIQRESKTV